MSDARHRIAADVLLRDPERFTLIDIREPAECASGIIKGSRNVPLSLGEPVVLAECLQASDRPVLLVCASGKRCERVLALPGSHDIGVLEGGMIAWRAAIGTTVAPVCAVPSTGERYLRHHLLPQVGRAGQERLSQARVVIIGAGGLGSPVAFYLAAAGIGHLTLIDDDVVDRSNLQRQILHTDARVGLPKVLSAQVTLRALNPDIDVVAVRQRFSASNADELLAGADLVVDGADNFEARYLLNDTAMRQRVPWVYGAVQGFAGQVGVFAPHQHDLAPCYRCLFPEPPGPGEAPNCAEAGVLGALPGLIGTLQATEALKWLLGLPEPLLGKLLCVDALTMQFNTIRLARDPACTHSPLDTSTP